MDSGCGSVGRAVPSDNRNSNPVIGKFYLPTINCIKRALKRQNIKYRKKWANPGLFLVYFRSFSNKHFNFSNKHFNFSNKQCNKWPCSIWCLGSNLQPSDCELHPITTRPGLPFWTKPTSGTQNMSKRNKFLIATTIPPRKGEKMVYWMEWIFRSFTEIARPQIISNEMSRSGVCQQRDREFDCNQCDQFGRFIALWATFESLWQKLFCPNCPDF